MTSTSQFGYFPVYAASSASGGITLQKSNVAQETDTTTGVTANGAAGVITMQSSTAAAETSETFTLTNSSISAGSIVMASVVGYDGTIDTNGIPVASVNAVADGSCDIVVSNAHSSNALAGVVQVAFVVM